MITYNEVAAAANAVPAAVQRIVYGGGALQYGELRLPAGSSRVPLVVLIHGGCWRAQYNLDHTRAAAAALVKEGYAVWSPEYRRLGDAGGGWPGTFDDVALAVDFVRTLATEHPHIDTARVVVMGHSAGGQLALWIASRTEGDPLRLAGVVSLAGITDLDAYGTEGSCGSAVPALMGGSADEQAARYGAVDPIRRVPIRTPVRLVHGELDSIVPLSQSSSFLERDTAAGGIVHLEVVPNLGHFDLVAPQTEAWPAVLRAVRSLATP
jgi:dipeptidyl aminopeptidase/acylaminoacyl peptidase